MAILTFDIGGTYVKYALWNKDKLENKNKFKTPDNWEEMKEKIISTKEELSKVTEIVGVSFSAPGAPNNETRQVEGESNVEYLHNFPIYDELEEALQLNVAFENDANCAALAELWKGNAQNTTSALIVVIGTGIGGAITLGNEIIKGYNNYAGEFGFMLLKDEENFGDTATAVNMTESYLKAKGTDLGNITAEDIFRFAEEGDQVAAQVVDDFFYYLAKGLYNLNVLFDPEKLLVGGGVSNLSNFIQRIEEELDSLYSRIYTHSYKMNIETCKYNNDANLIGAVYNFISVNNK